MNKEKFYELKRKGKLRYHHTSIARGYIRVGMTRYDDYSGRFGDGVIVHQETLHSSLRGNSHHYVHYYIYCSTHNIFD